MVTSGFFNSVNHDRMYDARQFSAIYDGVINDGIFANIGTCFVVNAQTGNRVLVGIGRAWFNHAWVLNDAILPIDMPASSVGQNRIDAIVIEIDESETGRKGSIKVVQGKAAANPSRPTLTNSEFIHQHPICYIYRTANSASIRQADITNMVGSTTTPFVTGILQVISLTQLLGQWEDELDKFIEDEERDFTTWSNAHKTSFNNWVTQYQNDFTTWTANRKNEFDAWVKDHQDEYDKWILEHQEAFDEWRATQESDFELWRSNRQIMFDNWCALHMADFDKFMLEYYNKTNELVNQQDEWMQGAQATFRAWLADLETELSGDIAGNLQMQIDREEIERILTSGFIDGVKEISDKGTTVTTTASDGRKLVKTFGEGLRTMTTRLFSPQNGELAVQVKEFSKDWHLISTTTTIIS